MAEIGDKTLIAGDLDKSHRLRQKSTSIEPKRLLKRRPSTRSYGPKLDEWPNRVAICSSLDGSPSPPKILPFGHNIRTPRSHY
jgi:hypothetical protein